MQTIIDPLIKHLNSVILGKEHSIKLALACLFARGHLLIEDLPGMGKTTLAHSLTQAVGLDFQRIQFTSDLLPADILGASIYDKHSQSFHYQKGLLFKHVILADEINRASPKTQSALLEAMEEEQVTVDGTSYPLPHPFFVIATQNPISSSGTYPLPESQLDRFLMKISLGYPNSIAERALLDGRYLDNKSILDKPLISLEQLLDIQDRVNNISVSDTLLDYLQKIIAATRDHPDFLVGLSPRGSLGLLRATKAWALLHGRNYATPEDVKAVLDAAVGHRIQSTHLIDTKQLLASLHTIPSVF